MPLGRGKKRGAETGGTCQFLIHADGVHLTGIKINAIRKTQLYESLVGRLA
jgi:hypothetical protein